MKKDFWKAIKFGLISGISMLSVLLAGFYLVNARTANYAGLESQSGDKLTSSKLNALVKRSTRIDVSTNDTALFDTGCERRRSSNGVMLYVTSISLDGTQIYYQLGDNSNIGPTYSNETIKNTEKNNLYMGGTGAPLFWTNVSKIQKKCQN